MRPNVPTSWKEGPIRTGTSPGTWAGTAIFSTSSSTAKGAMPTTVPMETTMSVSSENPTPPMARAVPPDSTSSKEKRPFKSGKS